MADPPAASDTDATHDRPSAPAAPRWVKAFAVIAALAAVILAVMLLAGAGHGPGRHTSQDAGGQAPTPAAQPTGGGGHGRPAGGHTP